jgi:hypothetical protein
LVFWLKLYLIAYPSYILVFGFYQEVIGVEISDLIKILLPLQPKAIADRLNEINSLSIPIMPDCENIATQGFVAQIGVSQWLDKIKPFLSDGSICFYRIVPCNEQFSEWFDDYGGYSDIEGIAELAEEPSSIAVYIRLGHTNTWVHIRLGLPISALELNLVAVSEEEDERYEREIESETAENKQEMIRLTVLVAKANGFNLLKSQAQREVFVSHWLKKNGENKNKNINEREIASRSISYYDFGVLPLRTKAMQSEGKSVKEIANELSHTQARIAKALLCEVSDEMSDWIGNDIWFP